MEECGVCLGIGRLGLGKVANRRSVKKGVNMVPTRCTVSGTPARSAAAVSAEAAC